MPPSGTRAYTKLLPSTGIPVRSPSGVTGMGTTLEDAVHDLETASGGCRDTAVESQFAKSFRELQDMVKSAASLVGRALPFGLFLQPCSMLAAAANIGAVSITASGDRKNVDDIIGLLNPAAVKKTETGFEPFDERTVRGPATRELAIAYADYLMDRVTPVAGAGNKEDLEIRMREYAIGLPFGPSYRLANAMNDIYNRLRSSAFGRFHVSAGPPNMPVIETVETGQKRKHGVKTKKAKVREPEGPIIDLEMSGLHRAGIEKGRIRINFSENDGTARDIFAFLKRPANFGPLAGAIRELELDGLAGAMRPVSALFTKESSNYYLEEVLLKGDSGSYLLMTTYISGRSRHARIRTSGSAPATLFLYDIIGSRFSRAVAYALKGPLMMSAIEQGAVVTEISLGQKYDNLYSIRSLRMENGGRTLLNAERQADDSVAKIDIDLSGLSDAGISLLEIMRKRHGARGLVGPVVFKEYGRYLAIRGNNSWTIIADVHEGRPRIKEFEARRNGTTFLRVTHLKSNYLKVVMTMDNGVKRLIIYKVRNPEDGGAVVIKVDEKEIK